MNLYHFTESLSGVFPELDLSAPPWMLVNRLPGIIADIARTEPYRAYERVGDALIHPSATIEDGAIIRGQVLITEDCFVAATAYLREGVMLGPNTKIGPGVEVKSSIIVGDTALAHLNYAGNSLLGSGVNLEAGAIIANHHNESPGRTVRVRVGQTTIDTGVLKFGAIIGDGCKVGANAVLSPGTILEPHQVVNRLALVDQSNQ